MQQKNTDDTISLNKYIADTGFCSRREADNFIAHGRVTINDDVAVPGNRVGTGDVVEIDGEPIGRKKKTIYIAYHKPVGVTSTTDTKDKTNIIDAISHKERIFPIGRLDKDSEGLIFLTNDGNIVNKVLRAGNEHEKEYSVTVDKPINREFVEEMAAGVNILGTRTKRCKVTQEGRSTFRITLTQGLNRQIRRMCSALGFEVTRLKRVRIMNVHLGGLPQGHWRYLTAEETDGLIRLVASSHQGPEASHEQSAEQAKRPRKQAGKAPDTNQQAARPAERAKPRPAHGKAAAGKSSSYKAFRKGARKGQ